MNRSNFSPDLSVRSSSSAVDATLSRKTSQQKTMTYLLLSVLVILAGVAVWKGLAKPPVEDTMEVMVTDQPIAPGCRITYDSLRTIEMPEDYYSERMFTSCEHLVGRYARNYIPASEPILDDDLFAENHGPVNQLKPGHRAITLNLPSESLVDNCIRPGDLVDVIATTTKDGNTYTRTICESMPVIMAAQKTSLSAEKSNRTSSQKATLDADYREAEILSQAAETSTLRLVLRSPSDGMVARSTGIDEHDILPVQAFPAPAPKVTLVPPPPAPMAAMPPVEPAKPRWTVEMFQGSSREEHVIE